MGMGITQINRSKDAPWLIYALIILKFLNHTVMVLTLTKQVFIQHRGYTGGYVGWQSRLSWNSHRVWCQGPRGGVKIVKDRITYPGGVYGYITTNKKAMKEFAWVKLSARPLEMR